MPTFAVEAILFDMDGTLIDSTAASEATWARWAARHDVAMDAIREVHHGRLPQETIALVAPRLDAAAEARLIYEEQECGVDGIHPIEGANAFFESVPHSRKAIVTAATANILRLRLGIVGLVPPPVCVTSDVLTAGKPDPAGYLLAAERLGRGPDECVVFEDAPAGLLAAHRAGMRSIAVLSNYTEAALRRELGEVVPRAFIRNFRGVSYRQGTLGIEPVIAA